MKSKVIMSNFFVTKIQSFKIFHYLNNIYNIV